MAILTGPSDGSFDGLQFGDVPGARCVASTLSLQRSRPYRPVKRGIDLIVSLTALIALAPVLLFLALVVALDSKGPILFRQTRVGQFGRTFSMLKFRTMRPERRVRRGAPPQDVGERRRRHKSIGDPRVTRVGRFLRRTCLDELPQLWNVLRGEMSLVGPRPELPSIVERYERLSHMTQSELTRLGLTRSDIPGAAVNGFSVAPHRS